ncbi:MAG: imidazole glycerol phosphate synthase subunit HisH [Candidatus Bipolaricaulia bacterium]
MKVTIADYGVGNLHSLAKALERLGTQVKISADLGRLDDADALVLPGVGAYGNVMKQLEPVKHELIEFVDEKPVLGVCLGMELLFEYSEESGGVTGLGLIPGRVERLVGVKVPHMGWNTVHHDQDPIFEGIDQDTHFYFVHSYAWKAEGEPTIAMTEYGGRFTAVVRIGNVYGTQFHPEKSSRAGLRLLENFVRFAEAFG